MYKTKQNYPLVLLVVKLLGNLFKDYYLHAKNAYTLRTLSLHKLNAQIMEYLLADDFLALFQPLCSHCIEQIINDGEQSASGINA